MIRTKATLVLGAGASCPYRFPLGEELKNTIVKQILDPQLNDRVPLFELLIDFGYSQKDIKEFAIRLRDSYYMSVDAFLEEWKDFTLLGKRAIAANLIDCEMRDELMTRESYNGRRKWYHYLLGLIGNREDFLSSRLSVITFNYDRSFEYFLFNTLLSSFNLPENEVAQIVKGVPIIHVHGQLGQPHFFNPGGRDYNNNINVEILEKYANEIVIIHEDVHTQSLRQAHVVIRDSELLVFIGFGYHRKNVERLMLRENYSGEKIVCTFTGKQAGEKERDMDILKVYTTSGRGEIPIEVYDGDALDFFRDTNYLK